MFDHIDKSADNQVRVKWEPNTIVIWDNRITAHVCPSRSLRLELFMLSGPRLLLSITASPPNAVMDSVSLHRLSVRWDLVASILPSSLVSGYVSCNLDLYDQFRDIVNVICTILSRVPAKGSRHFDGDDYPLPGILRHLVKCSQGTQCHRQ